jgi:transcription elongation GreA/GreB family factor
MSKAFVRDEDDKHERLPDRIVPPHPNLVTAKGLTLIQNEIAKLRNEHAAAEASDHQLELARVTRDLRYWINREQTSELTEPGAGENVQFGSKVTFRRAQGRTHTYRIVGIDEADPLRGTLSYVSPVAQALLGSEIGEIVSIAGNQAEILAIA